MKQYLFSFCILLAGCLAISSCQKDKPYATSINPQMTADIGTYKFIASAVRPATIDTQVYDTSTTLVITGYTSDRVNPYDKIVLAIANYKGYKGVTGTYSIAAGQASAIYQHGIYTGIATGGIVAITSVGNGVINGYFNFQTNDGFNIANGKYTVGTP